MPASAETAGLPKVDLSGFHASGHDRAVFLADLRCILHDHGFFYLSGHGVPSSLIADVLHASKRFFALPHQEKLAIDMANSPHFRGYTPPGGEYTRGARDWREQIDINTEAEAFDITPDTPPWKRLIGPNQWPASLPELKPVLLKYQAEATRVAIEVLKAIAVALGQDETAFQDVYTPLPNQLLKIIRYPGRDIAESSQGVGPHKDGGLVTVLLQDTAAGLRVQNEAGDWLDAPPIPGTFVINTGELLELATDGYLAAAAFSRDQVGASPPRQHFRLIPPPVRNASMIAGQERIGDLAPFPNPRPCVVRIFEKAVLEAFLGQRSLGSHHARQQTHAGIDYRHRGDFPAR
jgi:isopenicillin N synthase-like dioxygenase